jgi:aldehyde dehydrogenase (NAD+)
MNTQEKNRLFRTLGLRGEIDGASAGGEWFASGGDRIDVRSPAGGPVLARIRQSRASDYERVARQAAKAFAVWRAVPAPGRGEIVRQVAVELRR